MPDVIAIITTKVVVGIFSFLYKILKKSKAPLKKLALKETIKHFSVNRDILIEAFNKWKKSEIFCKYLDEQWEYIQNNIKVVIDMSFDSFYMEYKQAFVRKKRLAKVTDDDERKLSKECLERLKYFIERLVYLIASSMGNNEALKLIDKKANYHTGLLESLNAKFEMLEAKFSPPTSQDSMVNEDGKIDLEVIKSKIEPIFQEKVEKIKELIECGELSAAEELIDELQS